MPARRVVVVTAAGVVAAVAFVLAAVEGSSVEDALGARLDAVIASGIPGTLALVVADEGSVGAARGVADRATGEPVRVTDRFRAGSITKTFVAAIVLQLVAEGFVELDAPVERTLPGLVAREVTIRQLLSHTSGLSDYVDDQDLVAGPDLDPTTLTRRALARDPIAAPGERYAYASTNYLVLGLLVQRVTGDSLEHQLATRIFLPLGLRDTTFTPGVAELDVHGYERRVHDGIMSGEPEDTAGGAATWAWSAGAVVSTANDLATFMTALVRGRVVEHSLLALMLPDSGYGLGVAAFPTPCGVALGHTGNLEGYVSAAWVRPDGRRAVVVMANLYPLSAEADAAIHRVLGDAFCDALE